MQALSFYGIEDVRYEQVPAPDPADDELLIRVLYAGICGSDLHIYKKSMFIEQPPQIMGHEFVGRIIEAGSAVKGFTAGDVVVGNPMRPCLVCSRCKAGQYNTCLKLGFIGEVCPGCFADKIAVKATDVVLAQKPRSVRNLVLAEPFAVALNVCQRCRLTDGMRVAILGAGSIGLLIAYAASRLFGVTDIAVVDLSEARLLRAFSGGASTITQNISQLSDDYDVVIDAAGSPFTFHNGFRHVKADGIMAVVSIFEELVEFDPNLLVSSQLQLIGCNAYTPQVLQTSVQLIASGQIDPSFIITSEMSLDQGPEAFTKLVNDPLKKETKIIFAIGK